MGKRFDFEYIVLGGGAAGTAAALKLAQAKRKVALIEQDKWGGAWAASRDVPQKALFSFSHLYADAIAGSRFGISSENLRYNYPTVTHWRDKAVVKAVPKKKDLEDAGITCLKGKAHFVGTNDVAVGDGKISASKFLIATGSEMADNGISGLDTVKYYTPATAMNIERPPKAALVVGGGPSGLEVAQYYAELGAKVVIVELSSRLLPKEDEETSQVITQYFAKRLNIKAFTNTRVTALGKDRNGAKVVFAHNGQERSVRVETVVLATGSKPALEIGLQNARVSFDKTGLVVDRALQTSARNVFGAGDALGGDSSTEKAIYTAEVAVSNMLGRSKTFVEFTGFMRVVDTNPQIATVGMTEDELSKRSKKYKKILLPLSTVQASVTDDNRIGFIKMIADSQGNILGTSAICPHATEVLQEVALAMRHRLPLVQLASTPHVAGAWSDLVRVAARELVKKKGH